ncbi:hypothetical protein NQ318_011609 [Aromia moschata]|uniref:Uncharacterized protein n=1 Tax=Aromia moschata TaxID=1265417 RepID=A0AAV8Z6W1_9CUCU|nr:hypothetical protein NQ318_011609 [Aromia moschata]
MYLDLSSSNIHAQTKLRTPLWNAFYVPGEVVNWNFANRALAQVLLIPKSTLRNTERMTSLKKFLKRHLNRRYIRRGSVCTIYTSSCTDTRTNY